MIVPYFIRSDSSIAASCKTCALTFPLLSCVAGARKGKGEGESKSGERARRDAGKWLPRRLFLLVSPEAYHLEASKFSLCVRNNAGVFHPTNQSHGIFFAQIWNQRIELSLFK